jgi:ATP-dependent Clp protease ATP-binding subunit ClpB
MASDDFNESKYTEAAWSTIATLTKAADYYEASTIEAPILLDILLNPQKHNAGDDAEAAKRVVEKILQSAGANLKDLRSELEKYFAKQPKIGGAAQKMMGRSLQKVLETARETKSILGVSFTAFAMRPILSLSRDFFLTHLCCF